MRIICGAGQIARGMSADDWKLMKSVLRVSNNDDYNDDDGDGDDQYDDEEDDADDVAENDIGDDACRLSAAVAQKLMQAAD